MARGWPVPYLKKNSNFFLKKIYGVPSIDLYIIVSLVNKNASL